MVRVALHLTLHVNISSALIAPREGRADMGTDRLRVQLGLFGWLPPPLALSVIMSALLSRGGASLVNSAGVVCSMH